MEYVSKIKLFSKKKMLITAATFNQVQVCVYYIMDYKI